MKAVFEERYKKLNEAQKRAVDTTEGPVLVIAGPGSGKTELLSLRVVNILRQGNVGPQNILCLTFTNSGALNMRERLVQLMGADAYRVGIFTFHAFCSHVISRFPEYFYNAATFVNISDVVRAEILESIFAQLPHKHPLASYHPELGYAYLYNAKERIKHIKNGGFTPEEFRAVLEHTLSEYEAVHKAFSLWPESMRGKGSIADVRAVYESLLKLSSNTTARALVSTLLLALEKAEQENKTTTITKWQNTYTVKGSDGRILKEFAKVDKMQALADVYEKYTETLHVRGYYDYDDMIIDVSHALQKYDVLRAELEEQYQYVLIDEFQDTNEAQMNVVRAITQNEVYEGKANICVVGDDDQAIYKFQGAEISHMMDFRSRLYKDVQTIVLDKNYRSTKDILDLARSVIIQGNIRLENRYQDITKVLASASTDLPKGSVEIVSYVSDLEEYQSVVKKIRAELDAGIPPEEIAVIAREHKQLRNLLPHLHHAGIGYTYKKSANVFDEPHIRELITICEYLASGLSYEGTRTDLLPQILSFSFFNLPRTTLFLLAEKVKKENISWAKALTENSDKKVQNMFELLATLSVDAKTTPLEHVLNLFIEKSGFKEYYFSERVRKERPGDYVHFLANLKTFIDALREHKEGQILTVADVGSFVAMHKDYDIPLIAHSPYTQSEHAVSLLSAHDAKGLEFGSVYLINVHEDSWAKPSKRKNKITLPLVLNTLLTPAGDEEDDFIRLLYVAITRAKHTLHISSHDKQVRYLVGREDVEGKDESSDDREVSEDEIISLHEQVLGLAQAPYTNDEQIIFKRLVENYQMPVTHLTNFLNVIEGGPALFLERNLLRFPAPLNASGAYGSAVHKAIEEIITYPRFYGGEKPALKHVLGVFDHTLSRARLPQEDDVRERDRGHKLLEKYYALRGDFFLHNDQVEVDMKNEGAVVEGAHLTGKLDFLRIENNGVFVRDFKTGKAFDSWDRAKVDYEKVKLHNQKLQLIFYKILLENSNRFKNFSVSSLILEYVEGNEDSPVVELALDPSTEDVERTKKLIGIVYKKIRALDFPDVSEYSKDYKGILAFEDDLLAGKI